MCCAVPANYVDVPAQGGTPTRRRWYAVANIPGDGALPADVCIPQRRFQLLDPPRLLGQLPLLLLDRRDRHAQVAVQIHHVAPRVDRGLSGWSSMMKPSCCGACGPASRYRYVASLVASSSACSWATSAVSR